MKIFTLKKVANTVYIIDDDKQIWRTWKENEVTKRKVNNAIKTIIERCPLPIEIQLIREYTPSR